MKKRIMAIFMAALMLFSMSGFAAELGEEGDRTITISVQNGTGVEEGWTAVAEAYKAHHPEVEVVIDLKPSEGYDQWIQTAFTTEGTVADIMNINLAGTTATGKAINYLDYLDMDSPYCDGTWADQFETDAQVVNIATNSMTALSLESVQVLWLYNQDIFDEVGVEAPTTWAEFMDVCQKILDAGYQPLAISGDYDSFYSGAIGWLAQIYADQTTRDIIEVVKAQPGDFCYDPDVDGVFVYDPTDPFNDVSAKVNKNIVRMYAAIADGTYTADTAGMRTVWTNFAEAFPKYAGGDAFWGTAKDGEKSLFYQGKAAMFIDGGWGIIDYLNAMKTLTEGGQLKDKNGEVIEGAEAFRLGTFNIPSMEGEGIVAPVRTIEVPVGFFGAMSKSQAHDDMVADFLMFYSSVEGMSAYVNASLAAGAGVNGPSLVYGVQYPEEVQQAFDQLSFIGNAQNGYSAMLARGCSEAAENYRAFYEYGYKYLTGEIDLEQWMTEHLANIQAHLLDGMESQGVGMSDLENPQNEPTGN